MKETGKLWSSLIYDCLNGEYLKLKKEGRDILKESTKHERRKDQSGNGEQMQESNMKYYDKYYSDFPTLEEFTEMVKDIIERRRDNEKPYYNR